ncbi:hypothetical protein V8C86DRAFT_498933 [Haematococcus lacustris]
MTRMACIPLLLTAPNVAHAVLMRCPRGHAVLMRVGCLQKLLWDCWTRACLSASHMWGWAACRWGNPHRHVSEHHAPRSEGGDPYHQVQLCSQVGYSNCK